MHLSERRVRELFARHGYRIERIARNDSNVRPANS